MSEEKFLDNLDWRISKHYSDTDTIIDKDGFNVVDVNQTAILQDYEGDLGIYHWADSDDAVKEFTKDQYNFLQRMVSFSPDMLRFIESLEKWWPVDSDEYRELNRIVHFINNGEEL